MGPGEAGRTELTRVELNIDGQPIDGTEEIVPNTRSIWACS